MKSVTFKITPGAGAGPANVIATATGSIVFISAGKTLTLNNEVVFFAAPRPAIVPLVTVENWGQALAGVAVPDAAVVVDLPKHRRQPSRADLLFTHFGLSGPAGRLNLSDQVALLLDSVGAVAGAA